MKVLKIFKQKEIVMTAIKASKNDSAIILAVHFND